MNTFIYFIENRVNGKLYVGKAVKPQKRWKKHKTVARGGKLKYPDEHFAIHAAMSKYGIDNFLFVISELYPSNEAANEAEKFWISHLREQGVILYNETLGGDGTSPGAKFTEEHRRHISEARKGYKHTPEARARMSVAKKFVFAGEKHNKAKINTSIVLEIRQMYASGNHTHRELAKLFGLTHATVGKIIRRELWSHVL